VSVAFALGMPIDERVERSQIISGASRFGSVELFCHSRSVRLNPPSGYFVPVNVLIGAISPDKGFKRRRPNGSRQHAYSAFSQRQAGAEWTTCYRPMIDVADTGRPIPLKGLKCQFNQFLTAKVKGRTLGREGRAFGKRPF
jgi:hypothetical protein